MCVCMLPLSCNASFNLSQADLLRRDPVAHVVVVSLVVSLLVAVLVRTYICQYQAVRSRGLRLTHRIAAHARSSLSFRLLSCLLSCPGLLLLGSLFSTFSALTLRSECSS